MRGKRVRRLILSPVILLALASCEQEVGPTTEEPTETGDPPASSTPQWTWVAGSNVPNQSGIYGTQGVAASGNVPGARSRAASWIDGDGDFWVFGGFGNAAESLGDLNDLWRYDGVNWTWISGDHDPGNQGQYGTKGVGALGNTPPARSGPTPWSGTDTMWLFGGSRFSINGPALFNDLWRYDGVNWTWISGDDGINQSGTYGERGIASPANVPGARTGATGWVDSEGSLWLFGGSGFDESGTHGDLNDLWRFDGANWTWISGDNSANSSGEYPEEGPTLVERLPVPGGRSGAAGWIDDDNNLWVFGGFGYDGDGVRGRLNDMWYFDGSDWVWVSGSDSVDQTGAYGDQGVTATDSHPGARSTAAYWNDSDGFWLFGGFGFASDLDSGRLNDLWYFDGTAWTWITGADSTDQAGVYGTRGVAAPGNEPGARSGAAFQPGPDGELLLFGGTTQATDSNNDLWHFGE